MRFPKQFIVDGGLADMRDLPGGALRVLFVLIAEAGEDAIAEITQTDIARMAGVSRVTVQQCIKRLEAKGAVTTSQGRGKKHEYVVLPAFKLQSSPVNWFATYPQEVANPRVGNSAPEMQTPEYATPKSVPTRVLNSPTGTNNQNEPFARNALTTLRTDRHLPLSIDELLHHAYRLGGGDPWTGYLEIKIRTEASFTGARDLTAVIRKRLEDAA